MSTNSFAKNKEILEKFFQNRITFEDNTVFERAGVFYSIKTYEYSMETLEYIIDNIDGFVKYLDSLGRCKEEYVASIEIDGKELYSCEYFNLSKIGSGGVECDVNNLFEIEPFKVVLCVLYKKFSKHIKSDECVICLSKPPNILFCQCGHLCVCEKCENILEKERGRVKCPLCRKTNRIVMKI